MMIFLLFRRLCLLLALAGLVLAGTAGGPAAGQASAARVRLPGHRTLGAALGRPFGRVPAAQSISLTLALAARDPQGLDDLLRRLYDPRDPLYRHYLTSEQFTARFSPTPAQCAAVADFARAQGLSVTGLTADRLLLHLAAPSSVVEAAFDVHLTQYVDANGRLFHAPDAEPSVSAAVAPLIVSVVGLDDSAVLQPALEPQAANPPAALDAAPFQVGNGPGNGLTPADIHTVYNLSGVAPTGSGQTLAVFELDGYVPSDITYYENYFGLPQAPLVNIPVDGGIKRLGSGQAEVTLDIELQDALAPGAKQILVYEGPNSSQGALDTYSRIAGDNLAKQISTSWGLSEAGSGASQLNAESVLFQKMAAQGQTIYAASGDSGAYANGSTLSVQDPGSQPYVTSVGGTSLRTTGVGTPQFAYSGETTWNGGGGGVSAFWALPSWQQGVVSAASLGSTGYRNVPDVALDADPYSGYAIYVGGGWQIYGGTSCASPLWAAFTALVNQQRAANGAGSLGFACPALYALGAHQLSQNFADFHDIADGSTNNDGKGTPYYPAVAGYDDATGWGSFNGATLLADLVPPPAPTGLAATPGNAQVSLSWTAAPGATAYNLYRATTAGGEGSTPYKTGLTGTTYTDTGLTNGTTYYYVLTAVSVGGESARSNETSADPAAPVAPAPAGQVRYAPRPGFESRMVGGQFQGSADGVTYTTLYTVTSAPPAGQWTTAPLSVDPKTYRYLRYLAPDGCYGNIAEVEFDSGAAASAAKVTGTAFGTPGSWDGDGNDYTKALDGDLTTYFDAPDPGNGDYVGIDQGGTVSAPPVVSPPVATATALQINAGGPAVGAFAADQDFAGGGTYATAAAVDTSAVTSPAPQAAYQTERYGNFTYTLPGLAPGAACTVRLHFAEIYWTAPGQRLFNVAVNGQPALTNFDIFAAAGGTDKAVVESVPATADANGNVTVTFTTVRDNAKVSAIEVLPSP